jgi:hypothetical protein
MGKGDLSDIVQKDGQKAVRARIDNATAKIRKRAAAGHNGNVQSADSDLGSGELQLASDDRKFPLHCLPEVVRKMAESVATSANVPIELTVLAVLAVLSTVIGKFLRVKSGPDRTTSANLYILGFALSGTGKSEAIRLVFGAVNEIQQELIRNWKTTTLIELRARLKRIEAEIKKIDKELQKSPDAEKADCLEQELGEKLGEQQKIQDKMQSPPKIYTEDCTAERMATLLQLNREQLTLLSDDASKAIQNLLGRYNKLNMVEDTLLVKGYSLNPFVVDRQTRDPVDLQEPCINLFWLTQPDKIPILFGNESLLSGGCLARCLVTDTRCEPRKITGVEEPIPKEVKEDFEKLVRSLFENFRASPGPAVIYPTPEANQRMIGHFNSIVERRCGELRDINSFAARWNENAWRLAVNLHAAKYGSKAYEHQLEEKTVCDAIAIVKWFEEEQLDLLGRGRQEKLQEQLAEMTQYLRARDGAATFRELKRSGWSENDIRFLVANANGKVTMTVKMAGEKGGRSSEVVSLNV